jgi:phage protein D
VGLNIKPAFRLVANSEDITATIMERFVSLTYTDDAGVQSDSLQLTLSDHDPNNRIILPPAGAELELWLGYDNQAQRMGLFVVDEIEIAGPPDTVTVKAKAAPVATSSSGSGSTRLMVTTQKTRSWDAGLTLGGMVDTIAQEHGLAPAVAASLAPIVLPHVDQVNESDINLLTRLARDYDAIAKPAGGKLVLAKRGESKTVSGKPLPTITLVPGQVTSWRVTIAKRAKAGKVVAVWRDLNSASDKEVAVGDGEPVRRMRHQFTDQASAEKAARSEYDGGQRSEGTLSISMPGDPSVIAEARLQLSGFRSGVNGEWLVANATHSVDKSGYRCSIRGETI